jgi:hypothetical protein
MKLISSNAQRRVAGVLSATPATTLSKNTGIPAQSIRLIGLGQAPRTDTAKRLADHLGFPFSDWEPESVGKPEHPPSAT